MLIQVCQLNPMVGHVGANLKKVLDSLQKGLEMRADLTIFPELFLIGYPPEDLLFDPCLIEDAMKSLQTIAPFTKNRMVVVGLARKNPRKKEKSFCNSAAVFIDGELVGFKDKTLLPTYDVFDERRFFEPSDREPVFEFLGRKIGITICEDAWQHAGLVGFTDYKKDPILDYLDADVDLLLNISASPYSYNRLTTRIEVFKAAAKTLRCPVVVCNQVGANDQLIFDGHSLSINEKGEMIQLGKGFEEQHLWVDLKTHVCPCPLPESKTHDLFSALVLGVKDYFQKLGFKKAILGLSGGIDSALVAAIAVNALGAENVHSFFLPSRFSSKQSFEDAKKLAENLKISLDVISIESVFEEYLKQLAPRFKDKCWDVTEENLQARIRGAILMAIVNKEDGILLNTSNKSEIAMGYSTLYGDLCGGLSVIGDVVKTRVFELALFINQKTGVIPETILLKEPSAELKDNQKDSDTLPPYDVLDPIIQDLVEEMLCVEEVAGQRGVSIEFVQEIKKKIHLAEYKRRQAPICLRVTLKSFSKGRNIPIVSTIL